MLVMVGVREERLNEKKLLVFLHLFLIWKGLLNKILYIFLLLLVGFNAQSQDTSAYYTRFKDKIVLFSDIGYASAPFRIVYPFEENVKNLRYRNNFSPVLGLGVSYKWFSLRLGFALKGTTRSVSRFGRSTYFDIGTSFQVKNWFFDLDARSYKGYAIKNAYTWNDTLSKLKPNDIRPNTQMSSLSMNAWYFMNKHFNMQSVMGRTGHYERNLGTFYLKPTISIHGVGNDASPLIPNELQDTLADKTRAHVFSSLDFGVVPGYAYVYRKNNWQICGFLGLGGVVQAKFFFGGVENRGFLGLAPRYDLKFYGGYSVPKYFVFMSLDFDNKSIRFTDLKYRQSYFTWKITAGIRLDKKQKEKVKD
jgi:Domain of unknown function (DUF4421)